ncbi:MAG: hypothetical protein JJU29_21535 [Verrucomicrobia bacterium]|nr:hypothetical protein [Verrucomicrobiota bacterium]MCH8512366.1 hypothetical protein [Kiritimatiellia bacterium]
MKFVGCILVVFGIYLGMAAHPLFFLAAAIGFLCFLQGIENAIIANTTEYVRRAITENKTYEDLMKEKFGIETSENSTDSQTEPRERGLVG